MDDARRIQGTTDEVIVYRGDKPFLGAGAQVRSWSAAIQLRAKNSSEGAAADVPMFRPAELQDYIAQDLENLRKASDLTPGWRLAELGITRWAMMSAAELPFAPGGSVVMAQLHSGTYPQLAEKDWVELANSSPEWVRFYRCYRIEGWARQLAVSGFLHVGCESRTLVLEWRAFVLPPIAASFRGVDHPPNSPELRAAWAALGDLALLPTTIPSRITDVVRGLRGKSDKTGGSWSTPGQAADVFGAAASVRELGAGQRLNNIFQESDCDRYLKILERRVLDAVHRFLDERGISAKGFDEMVTQINNSTVLNNSSVIAGNIGGSGNIGAVESGGVEVGETRS
ncbi:hypothetical protein AB0L63_10245 [Nocardia sp. NPDC051990]|uniref:hypothetical protein n=1 Tax=Nocardia sp. NPDC051990 TaxID=3155285 RepID=UPI003444E2E9